jgi:hypothetical protein
MDADIYFRLRIGEPHIEPALSLAVDLRSTIALFEPGMEDAAAYWIPLQRRLTYQGFVLLPILGIGPFIFPRFFGLPSPHDFPDSLKPSAAWKKKASLAFSVGALIIVSFFVESAGWVRTAHALRFGTTAIYLLLEFPFRSAPKINNGLLKLAH